MRITAIAITVLLSATLAAQAPPARIPSSTFDPARAPIIDRALQRYVDPQRSFRTTETVAQLNPPPVRTYQPTYRLSGG